MDDPTAPEPRPQRSAWLRTVVLICSWDPEPMEIQAGFLGLWLALVLLAVSPHLFQSAPGPFRAMQELAPEKIWGSAFGLLGLLRLLSVTMALRSLGDIPRFMRAWRVRRCMALSCVVLYTFTAAALGCGNWRGLGVVFFSAQALTNAVVYWRLSLR